MPGAVGATEGPAPNAAETRADGRRGMIVTAAAHEIALHGIAGLRVEKVAAAADVSVSLLYYHFGDRAGLVRAAFQHASERAPSTALRLATDEGTGYEALERALLGELSEDQEVREAAVVWGEVCARAAFDPEYGPVVASVTEGWASTVAEAIGRGVRDGSIRDGADPGATAQLLITLVDGLCVRWLAGAIPLEQARTLLRATVRDKLMPQG